MMVIITMLPIVVDMGVTTVVMITSQDYNCDAI